MTGSRMGARPRSFLVLVLTLAGCPEDPPQPTPDAVDTSAEVGDTTAADVSTEVADTADVGVEVEVTPTCADLDCDDGNACTVDTCVDGACSHSPLVCDDGDACTQDDCDVTQGCLTEPISCDDGDACTDDTCDAASGCQHVAVVCDASDPCVTVACDSTQGCVSAPVTCDDANPCTDDSCDSSVGCTTNPTVCDDGDACTTDACDPATGCTATAITCFDGDLCVSTACDPATGCSTDAIDCDDGSACTIDTCDSAEGCQYAPVVCDDGLECTIDVCDPAIGCTILGADCEDGNPCTNDVCTPGIGCSFIWTEAPCDDGDVCTTDACVFGACLGTPSLDCDDGDVCTIDTCDATLGCQHTPQTCDDNDACTTEVCDSLSGCVYTAVDCDDGDPCTNDACDAVKGCGSTPVTCDTGDPCTTGFCNAAGDCETTANSCDDDNACTTETCVPGVGCSYSDVVCDDGNVCTFDSCDEALGCQHETIGCGDDGVFCTEEVCDPIAGCQPVAFDPQIHCDDGDPCTDDDCDPLSGCVHTPNTGPVCDHELACATEGFSQARCLKGVCSVFNPQLCEQTVTPEQQGCVTFTCDDTTSCIPVPLPDGTLCPFAGNSCQEGGQCLGGVCTGLPGCDDGNPCTDDFCANPGCGHTPTPGVACDGSDSDACELGTCVGSTVDDIECVEPGVATGQRIALRFDESTGYESANHTGPHPATILGGGSWVTNGSGSALALDGTGHAIVGIGLSCGDLGPTTGAVPGVCALGQPCAGAVTYDDAVTHCQENGGRLCHLSEVEGDVLAGSGCPTASERVWTATPCAPGSLFTIGGSSTGGLATECTPLDAVGVHAACCADEAPALGTLEPGSAYTLEAWVRQTTTAGTQNILTITAPDGAGGGPGIKLRIKGGTPQMGQGGCGSLGGGPDLAVGEWHHLVAVHNGFTGALYVNGVVRDSGSDAGICVSLTGRPLVVGGRLAPSNPGVNQRLQGEIDNVSVYDRALTQAEVERHFAAGRPDGLVEVCNGVDDDCTGGTDSTIVAPCDDNDPCTTNACEGGGCTFVPKCTGSKQFCEAATGSCVNKYGEGVGCTDDAQCRAGTCLADGTCACSSAAKCPASEYCAGDGTCQPDKGWQETCTANNQCLTHECKAVEDGANVSFCTCDADQDPCAPGFFCSLHGDLEGRCLPQIPAGKTCGGDYQCLSGDCDGWKCKCDADNTCPSGEFCNADGLCQGTFPADLSCSSNDMCRTGSCLPSGVCGCSDNHPCFNTERYCDDATGGCADWKPPTAPCSAAEECESGVCVNGSCGCTYPSLTDCGPTAICHPELLTCIPLGNYNESCIENFALSDMSCATGECREWKFDGSTTIFKCGCTAHEHCPDNRWCSPSDNVCYEPSKKGECEMDEECLSGICFAPDPLDPDYTICGCASEAECWKDEFCNPQTWQCEAMVETPVYECTGQLAPGVPCPYFACQNQIGPCPPLVQTGTVLTVPVVDPCVVQAGTDVTVNCFGSITLEQPVTFRTGDAGDWSADTAGYETSANVTVQGVAVPLGVTPLDGSSAVIHQPSGFATLTAGVGLQLEDPADTLQGADLTLTNINTGLFTTLKSTKAHIHQYFSSGSFVLDFCEDYFLLTAMCDLIYAYDYVPPLQTDRGYLAFELGADDFADVDFDFKFTWPFDLFDFDIDIPDISLFQGGALFVDPNDQSVLVQMSRPMRKSFDDGKLKVKAAGFSSKGLFEHTTKLELPFETSSPCTSGSCSDGAYLEEATVHGHVHTMGYWSTKLASMPITVFGEATVDLDPNDDGLLNQESFASLFGDGFDTEELEESVSTDFVLVADGLLVLGPNLNVGDKVLTFGIPVAEASLLFDSRLTPVALPISGIDSQQGVHFRGKSIQPDLPDALEDYIQAPSAAQYDVAGYFISSDRFWFRFEGMPFSGPGVESGLIDLTVTPTDVRFSGELVTLLGTFEADGWFDADNGNFGFCSKGAVQVKNLNIGFEPTASVCFSKVGTTTTFSLDVGLDVDFDLSRFIEGTICGWLDYDPDKASCEGDCDWDTFWNCVSYVPGIGDELQGLVDAACNFGTATIEAVSEYAVKACKYVAQSVDFRVRFKGDVAIDVVVDQTVIQALNLAADMDLTISFTVPGTGRTTDLKLDFPAIASDGTIPLVHEDLPFKNPTCLNIFNMSIGCP